VRPSAEPRQEAPVVLLLAHKGIEALALNRRGQKFYIWGHFRGRSARARAEAAFPTVTPEEKQTATDEYRAKQAAALDNMARLRAMRLARNASG
jgi:hypothetical protein